MWENIYINSNNIIAETNKAFLIKMPNKSIFKGFQFWYAKKLCRLYGKNNFLISIAFTKDFRFKIKRMGKGQTTFNKVLSEKEIGVKEMKLAFNIREEEEILDDLKD